MNKKCYRVVFNRVRDALIVVQENGNAPRTTSNRGASGASIGAAPLLFACRPIAFAATLLVGTPLPTFAQIVPTAGSSTQVIQTQNGVPQVNVARPSSAGVSLNTYNQFDVQKNGAILNNASTIVNTQLAGYVNGNPNYAAGQSAKIIVNQVFSNNPSLLNGYVEVAGPRAEVVIANPSGIQVDGGGFINTSRAVLTTGVPYFGANGSLGGFNVSQGLVTVQGAGLNAANVDQVDLIARAVQANAAIYAKDLNVIAGANQVNHDTLTATPITGTGAAPSVAIDVSQLGGMYANRIFLSANEYGVGVSNQGVLAAQAGDLTLQSSGQLVLAGKTNASGNLSIAAQGGLHNSGTTYGQQAVTVSTAGVLSNTGTLAAQQNLNVTAGSVNSTGTLGAGIGSDGSIGQSGDLSVATSGALSATGQNAAGGNAALQGASLNLAGSQTSANGTMTLAASSGDLNLAGSKTSAGGALSANATGTLTNDNATLSSAGAQTITAGALSNQRGQIISGSMLSAHVAGAISNRGGKLAAQSSASVSAASLDNSAGGYVGARDVAVTTQGALNNAGGTLAAANALTVSAQSIANDGGAIENAGSQATTVSATGALTNTHGGLIGGNGDVSVTGGSLDNSNGTIAASGAATVHAGSTLANAAGLIRGNGNVSVGAAGAIGNVGGQIESSGISSPSTTLQITGASLDNTNGRIANIGTGATTLDVASITNALTNGMIGAGMIGGNGDVMLTGQTLANTQGAQIVAGHDLTLNEAQSVDNTGGTLSGANNLTLNEPGASVANRNGSIHGNGAVALSVASLDNTSGRIGNDAGSGGSIAISAGSLSNQGGAIGSDRNLRVTTNQLTGDGAIIAGNDGSITVNGDYTHDAANQIQANHDLTLTTAGNLTNRGTLAAVNALTVNAANVDNQAGADLNSASTTVNASQAITNEGRLEGDTITTNSASLTNTGTIVGNDVTLSAGDLSNTGASAAIAAASLLNFYVPGTLSNTGGATIFSLGDINIAANGTRDASGLLANRSNAVTNDQSTLEAQGNLEIATQTLTNSRPAPTVQTVTTDVTTLHQTKRPKYMNCATTNADPHSTCTQAVWDYGYKYERTDSFAASSIVSQDPSQNQMVLNVNGQLQTIYYSSMTNNGGTVTLTYWDDYNPNVNYRPDTEYPTRSDAHHGYQRVEIARDTTTTTQQDQIVGPQARQAQLLAGGKMTLANVGTIDNLYSAIAAGNAIQIGSTQQGGAVGSGNYGGTTVNNVGQTLYQYQSQNIVSTYAWNEDITRDVGTVVEAPVVLTPVAIGGTGGTIVANNAVQINATSLNNTNVAAANSATGATGGTLGAASGRSIAINAPQSMANGSGALSITLPTNGLYSIHPAPGQPYLIATDPRLTSYTTFISSDYMLGQLGLNPQSIQKRLGDGLYEEQMVRNQITQLTGRVYLQGYTSNEDEYRALMTAGVNAAKQFSLEPGIALTPAQMDALTSDIVWLVSQTVTLPDGSTQQVLAPVVYLAHTHANDLQPSGALIAADDVALHATGSAVNSGVIKGGTQTVVTATDIVNRGGSIGSSARNGTTVLSASNDVINASGQITGNRVAVLAGHDILDTTLVDTRGVSAASGDSKVNTSLVGRQGSIASTGDLLVSAGRDLTVHGANLTAGGDAQIGAGRNLLVDTVQSTTNQSVDKNANHHWEASNVTHATSTIATGGSLAMQSGNDATFKGASVSAGQDLSVIAGGNLTATTVTDTAKFDNVATDSKTRQEVDHTYDEHAVGTRFTAGGNATLAALSADASKGNVTLTGSSLTAGSVNGKETGAGAATLAGTGNVTINEAREEHDSATAVHVNRGSFVSSTSTDSMQSTQANIGVGSTVSGDTVNVRSGRDLTIRGATVVGTHDVDLSAKNNVAITTFQNTEHDASAYQEHKSGLMTSGLSVTIGSSSLKATNQSEQVTNTGSTIGSLNGNLNVSAGNDLHVTGSDLIAGKNVTGAAANVVIDSAVNTARTSQSQQTSSSGVTLGLSGSVGDAINGAYQQTQAAKRGSGDSRATALHAIAAAGDAAIAVAGVTGDALAGSSPSIGIQVSVGSSHSSSNASEVQTTQQGANVVAGGTTTFVATGNGAPGSGNITVAGSNVSGTDVILAAKNQIDLLNTTNTDSTRSSNASSGGSVGVSFGTNGIGVSASMQNAHGDANSDAAMQNNTHVSGANSVTLLSGGDTNIVGSNVAGGTVTVAVGGNLNIRSVQDTTRSAAHQSSASGGFNASTMGGSASFSAQNGHAGGNYAQVNEQAGIQAGNGGFDITVQGNTNLTGAYIASTANASKNSLTTGTLSFSDIENHSHYSATSNGLSAGAGVGATGKATGPGSVSGSGGVSPMISQNENGDQSATTKSGISPGSITLTNPAGQMQDLASLNRDTSNLNGRVDNTPDVNNLLNRQADVMQAAQAAGQVVAQGIGAYADMKQQEAQSQADAAAWAEGGTNRVLLHVAGGALVAGLGGSGIGSAAAGAVGAGVSAAYAGKLNSLTDEIGAAGSMLLGNIASNVLAGAAGALVGGSAGAFTASNADLYNRSTGNANGTGGTGNEFLDRFNAWAEDPLGNTNRALNRVLPSPFGQQPPADPLIDVTNGGHPPAAGGSVVMVPQCEGPVCTFTPVPAPGASAPGYAPGNATLNSGDSDRYFGGKSTSDLSDAAKVPDPSDKSGELSGAGRALQKHGGRDGSAFPAAKGNPTAINEQGQAIVDNILNDPGSTAIQRSTGRFGEVIDVTAPDGRGVRFSADGKFITFLEPKSK